MEPKHYHIDPSVMAGVQSVGDALRNRQLEQERANSLLGLTESQVYEPSDLERQIDRLRCTIESGNALARVLSNLADRVGGQEPHTAEALAALDGTPLKQIGPGGRDLKNKAQAYIDNAAGSADVTAMAAELAALKQQLAERDEALRLAGSVQRVSPPQVPDQEDDDDQDGENDADDDDAVDKGDGTDKSLEDCSNAELKAFIARESGEPVRGNPSRQTLIDRAMELATAPDADDKQG